MDVLISEVKTGRVVARVPVVIGGIGYTPTEAEYFAEAWRCAVDDKSVDPDRKKEYRFELRSDSRG
jgi:hypothetical protein